MSAHMNSAEYWRERCHKAERLLQAARAGIEITAGRREVLRALSELRAGESISTEAVAQRVGRNINATYYVLSGLRRLGLVDVIKPDKPAPGAWALWHLGHLVVLEETDEAGA